MSQMRQRLKIGLALGGGGARGAIAAAGDDGVARDGADRRGGRGGGGFRRSGRVRPARTRECPDEVPIPVRWYRRIPGHVDCARD